ncbi:MAG TPA: hypothetical protein VNZ26_17185 [Vicinamibacterales bacterium]|nr:hypothetical protein [Vicinamibacterales bacterium]
MNVKSSDTNTFSVSQTGEVDVTLTTTTPASATLGLGLGTGSPCSILAGGSVTAQAGSTPQLTGKATPGTLCVQVYDPGNDTGPVTYTLTVAHP